MDNKLEVMYNKDGTISMNKEVWDIVCNILEANDPQLTLIKAILERNKTVKFFREKAKKNGRRFKII